MNDQSRVYVRARKRSNGRPNYHIQWIDPTTKHWKSEKVGPSRKQADQRAALREKELTEGAYKGITKTTWDAFVQDHVFKVPGESNAVNIRQALDEFGDIHQPKSPSDVSFAMAEAHVAHLRKNGNAGRTINRKVAILRRAMALAVRRGFVAVNPIPRGGFGGWQREPVEEHLVRMVTRDEEAKLIEVADNLLGLKWSTFIIVAIETGARRGELVNLEWHVIDFKGIADPTAGPSVLFVKTKTHKDRRVPLSERAVTALRRLQVQTLRDPGPFGRDLLSNTTRRWKRIVAKADIPYARIHDLRGTFCTRAIRAGIDPKTVQTLAGHRDIKTTLKYYTAASTAKTNREAIELMAAVG